MSAQGVGMPGADEPKLDRNSARSPISTVPEPSRSPSHGHGLPPTKQAPVRTIRYGPLAGVPPSRKSAHGFAAAGPSGARSTSNGVSIHSAAAAPSTGSVSYVETPSQYVPAEETNVFVMTDCRPPSPDGSSSFNVTPRPGAGSDRNNSVAFDVWSLRGL